MLDGILARIITDVLFDKLFVLATAAVLLDGSLDHVIADILLDGVLDHVIADALLDGVLDHVIADVRLKTVLIHVIADGVLEGILARERVHLLILIHSVFVRGAPAVSTRLRDTARKRRNDRHFDLGK